MWLPTPLYEALPFLYGLFAVLTLALFGSSIAYLSAVLFALAGLLVWRMRRTHRLEQDEFHVV